MTRTLARRIALAAATLFLASACGDDPAGPAAVATVEVTSPAQSIIAGQTALLSAVVRDGDGAPLTGRPLTWSSDPQAVATVDAAGMVRAVSPGLAVITATSEGKTGSVTVTILPVPVASVTITPSPAEVRVGLTTQLSVVARDAAGNALGGRPVTLATSNAAVATVDANRVVTGVSAGTATITATSEGKTATVTVTVTPGPVTAVEVAPGAQSVSVGSTVQLSASARDASGAAVTGRAVAWSTSNPVIATVSAAGVVTGMAAGGPVSITATVEGRSASAQITVTPAPVATLTISPNPAEVRVGLTTQLAVVARDAAGNELGGRPVTITTSNASIATVDANRVVTGMSAGTVTITATSEGITATATVTVTPGPVTSVEVTPTTASVSAGSTVQLSAVARDASGAAVTGRELSWTSSNPSIATVSATGLVTGVAEGGPVTISAIVEGKSASARIMVTPAPVATLTISPDPLAVQVGSTAALMLVARDAAGNQLGGRLVTLTTSNAAVATVDANRMVTGVSAGTATITATSEGKTATATVIVAPGPVASVEIAPTAPSVRVGATIPMTATLRDASGAVVTGRIVTWTSSDPGKATVSGTGVVTGVAVGTATITATSEGKSASTTVTILRMPVSSVEVLGVGTLIVGDTVRVQAIVRDSLGRTLTDRVVTFRGSNDAVATVSSSGLVSAFSAGNVTVTATSEGVSGTTEIAVADVRVSFTGGTCLTVRVGATCTSSANLRYVGSNNIVPNRRPTTIVSSNSSIAQTGAPEYPESSPSRVQVSVTGVAPGTVTLTARYVGANGTIRTDTMEFTVQP